MIWYVLNPLFFRIVSRFRAGEYLGIACWLQWSRLGGGGGGGVVTPQPCKPKCIERMYK